MKVTVSLDGEMVRFVLSSVECAQPNVRAGVAWTTVAVSHLRDNVDRVDCRRTPMGNLVIEFTLLERITLGDAASRISDNVDVAIRQFNSGAATWNNFTTIWGLESVL